MSECTSTDFIPLRSSPYTASISMQQMRVQEVQRDQGRVPPVVDCTLTADLTEKWCPGDVVTVTGIVKISGEETKMGSSHTVPVYIKVISVTNNKSQTGNGPGEQFNLKDYYCIKEIHSEPKLFRLLVHSLNPAIYGHELVKAGLLLGLFGGSENENARSESHILVVGDPGLGKSQMLQACANIAPKGLYCVEAVVEHIPPHEFSVEIQSLAKSVIQKFPLGNKAMSKSELCVWKLSY